MIETLRSVLVETPTVVHECRECGRTVDSDTDRCPTCGADGIATYPLD